MLLAEVLALPTVNGYATFTPLDWGFAAAEQPDYLARVHRYLQAHGLRQGVCGLDLLRHGWTGP
jgi:hypothetical protein